MLASNFWVRERWSNHRYLNFKSLAEKIDVPLILLFVFIFSYVIFFSYVTITRIFTLQTYAYDLGIYNQAIHSTLTGQGFLHYTADLLANPSGSIFGVHVSFILLIITPIYSLFPAPQTLLVIQSLVLGLGALPVYLIAKNKLQSKNMALVFSLAFLLSPALMGINWYDFHPEAFIVLPMLFTIYFNEKNKWLPYFVSVVFVLLAMDKAAMLIIVFGLFGIISIKKEELFKKPKLRSRMTVYLVTIILGLAWFLFTVKLGAAFNPNNMFVSGSSQYWYTLGARNLIEIPSRILLQPDAAINALSFDWISKLNYLIILFVPVLFLILFAPRTIILLVPWLAISLLSNYPPYYQIGTQYPAFVIPAVFYGSIIGLNGIMHRFKKHHFLGKLNKKSGYTIIAAALLVSTLAFQISSGPFSTMGIGRYQAITYGFPWAYPQSIFVTNAIKLVPENASVLTQNNIFPLFSNRENAYVTPTSVFYPPGTSFVATLTAILGRVNYIIVDSESIDGGIILSQPMVKENFGLLASGEGIVLLKRGYISKPVLLSLFNETFDYQHMDLLKNVTIVKDPQSISSMVLFHSRNSTGDFWYGPYIPLPPGQYQATFRLKIDNLVHGEVLELRVNSWSSTIWATPTGDNMTGYHINWSMNWTDSKKIISATKIYGDNFTMGKYQEFSLNFTVDEFAVYEFIGVDVKTSVGIYFDEARVIQITPDFKYKTDLR